jgi:hypothetical protein
MYLKIRKQREIEWDLPGQESKIVDNRSWRKLLDMELKAFKLVEEIVGLCSQAAKLGIIKKDSKPPEELVSSHEEGDILAK